jgi:hypothetical protein
MNFESSAAQNIYDIIQSRPNLFTSSKEDQYELFSDIVNKAKKDIITADDVVSLLESFQDSNAKQYIMGKCVEDNLFSLPLLHDHHTLKQSNESPQQTKSRQAYNTQTTSLASLYLSNRITITNLMPIIKSASIAQPGSSEQLSIFEDLEDEIIQSTLSSLTDSLANSTTKLSNIAKEELKLALNTALSSPQVRQQIIQLQLIQDPVEYGTKFATILSTTLKADIQVNPKNGNLKFKAAPSGIPDLLASLPGNHKWTVGFATIADKPADIEGDSIVRHTIGAAILKSKLESIIKDSNNPDLDPFSVITGTDCPNRNKILNTLIKDLHINPIPSGSNDKLVAITKHLTSSKNTPNLTHQFLAQHSTPDNPNPITDFIKDHISTALQFKIQTAAKKPFFFKDLSPAEEQVVLMTISFARGLIDTNQLSDDRDQHDEILSTVISMLPNNINISASKKNLANYNPDNITTHLESHDHILQSIIDALDSMDDSILSISATQQHQYNTALSLLLLTSDHKHLNVELTPDANTKITQYPTILDENNFMIAKRNNQNDELQSENDELQSKLDEMTAKLAHLKAGQ